jgi:putative ATPase
MRCTHYDAAKELGSGIGYENSHQAEQGVNAQDYLGVEKRYYFPVGRGFEKELQVRLEKIRAILHPK